MKHLKLFFALFAMLALGVGNAWGEESFTIHDKFTSTTMAYATTYTADISVSDLNGGNSTVGISVLGVYKQAKAGTTFQTNKKSGHIKNTSAIPGKITKIVVSHNASYQKNTLKVYGAKGQEATTQSTLIGTLGTQQTDETISFETGEYNYFLIDPSTGTGSAQMTSITIYYTSSSGSTQPVLSVSPENITWKGIAASAEKSEEITVTLSNIEAVMAELSGDNPTAFSIDKDLLEASGKIIVSKNTTTIGDYAAILTITDTDTQTKTIALSMEVVADPEPTGTFEKFTGTIEEGDYVLVANGTTDALKNTITSNRFDCGTVEVAEDKIVNPDKSVIWHIAANGTYWTMYNESTTKYAGGTTTRNQGALLDDVTDLAKWTITVDGEGVYTFENYGRSQQPSYADNKFLSRNSQTANAYWATYASGQKNPVLYKKSTPADPTTVATPVISGTDNFYNSTEVSITCTTPLASIYYTLDDTEPTTSSTLYSAPFPLNATTTIKAIAVKADMTNSAVAEKTFTKATVLTVADALTAIDNGGDLTNKYVKGTISQITKYDQTYSSIYYYISDDGTKTNELYVYSGKGLNSADFSAATDLTVGDDVIICGTLKEYNNVKEFDYNNYLVYHKPIAQLSWSSSTCAAEIDAVNEFPTLTKTNGITISYTSSNTAAATIDENTGEISLLAEGETNITATFAGNENYKANSASYTLTVAEAVVRGTITYNTNGGTEVAAQENQTNLPETLPTTTKAGYNFGGWYTDAECNTPAVANSVLTGDITLYAKWLEPYTVAQALAMNVTTGVYVKGIISTITEVNTDYKNATYKISDDGTTTSEMIVYRGKNVDNTDFTSEDQIAVGDIVVIYGNLSEYNSAIQLAQGNYIYSLTKPTLYTVTISFETNGGETVASIEANTLPDPLPTTTKDGYVFDGWYMDNALTIPAVAGTPITTDADITLYAKWVEVSKWATTYTSNIEVGSNQYSVIIGGITYENQSQRYGNGSTAGYAILYLPAETETLHFHAAGWYSEDVTITAKIGEEILGTFELKRDEGISGNSTTYTLQGNTSTEQYFYIDLTSYTIAANTAITFEATEGKRFLLYGVNQEGGIAPELNRIEIIGEATELTYEIGDVFDPAGLGVNAIYTLAGVDHETVAIDAEDVEWSFNPATIAAETSQVEVTATYMETTAIKIVTGLIVNVPTPEITVSPTSIDWGTVAKDSEASREVSVTLKAVANATITISGTNPSTFSVDKTALTETGTIVVSANTSSIGTFTATLTISDDAAAAEEKKISLKIIVEGIDDVYGNWQLVTDASTLKAGDMVIVASVEVEGKYYTMGKQNSNNRAAIESTVNGSQLTPTTGTSVLTLVDAGDGKFAFQASNDNYLYAASSTSNHLKETATINDNAKWSVSVTEGKASVVAQGSNSRNTIRFNKSNTPKIFSCYASGQQDIALYARVPDYSRTTSVGRYGTICLPFGSANYSGATFYEFVGSETGKVYLGSVTTLEAGVPYIFEASANELAVYSNGTTTDNAGNKNGLHGTFDNDTEVAVGNYILKDNKLCQAADICYVNAYRAYIVMSEVPTGVPTQMPGRRYIGMDVQGENVETGVEDLFTTDAPVKVIENGQLIIIRDGVKYNVQGQKL